MFAERAVTLVFRGTQNDLYVVISSGTGRSRVTWRWRYMTRLCAC